MDGELADRLQAVGAVVVEGPKACGKTETTRQVAKSEVLLDVDDQARAAAAVDPAILLGGPTPRLIDEWQVEPRVWDHIRRAVDDRGAPGQFVLTGSAVPPDDVTRHSGAGRFTRLRMRPMSLSEAGLSSAEVSLSALNDDQRISASDGGLTIRDIAEEVVRGGWPGLRELSVTNAAAAVRDYLVEIQRVDVERVDGRRRDPERVARLVRSLARNVAGYAAATTLAADTGGSKGPLKDDTVREYLSALERLMIVEDQPAWAPRLRSRTPLRSGPKRAFVDPSLAAAALDATPDRLLGDLETLGLLFESLVLRDLRVYAQATAARVLQYRDAGGLEVDAIVQQTGPARRDRRDRLRLHPPRRGGRNSGRRAGAVRGAVRALVELLRAAGAAVPRSSSAGHSSPAAATRRPPWCSAGRSRRPAAPTPSWPCAWRRACSAREASTRSHPA